MTTGLVYAGRVVDVEAGGPRVVVPQIGGSSQFGPLPSAVADLAIGEAVIVTNLGTSRDQLVVLGRMAGRVPEVGEIPGLAARLAAIETVNTGQDTRLGVVEGKNTEQDGRLTSVEGVNTTQAGAITSNATGITTLRADTAGRVTTKGDLLVADAAGSLVRRGVGANSQVMVADSTQPDGVAWRDMRGLPLGLAGVTAATRWVGATDGGAPTTGAFLVGDHVLDRVSGHAWVCTVAGSPGTWVSQTKSAADRLTVQEGYEKYGWQGSAVFAHDATLPINAWPTADPANTTRIASPNTTGQVVLGKAGRWALALTAYSNAVYSAYSVISLKWDGGAWQPIVDLADGRWRGAGFGGAGQLWQMITWTGWVNATQAALPIKFYVQHINLPNAETVTYSYWAQMNYLGGA